MIKLNDSLASELGYKKLSSLKSSFTRSKDLNSPNEQGEVTLEDLLFLCAKKKNKGAFSKYFKGCKQDDNGQLVISGVKNSIRINKMIKEEAQKIAMELIENQKDVVVEKEVKSTLTEREEHIYNKCVEALELFDNNLKLVVENPLAEENEYSYFRLSELASVIYGYFKDGNMSATEFTNIIEQKKVEFPNILPFIKKEKDCDDKVIKQFNDIISDNFDNDYISYSKIFDECRCIVNDFIDGKYSLDECNHISKVISKKDCELYKSFDMDNANFNIDTNVVFFNLGKDDYKIYSSLLTDRDIQFICIVDKDDNVIHYDIDYSIREADYCFGKELKININLVEDFYTIYMLKNTIKAFKKFTDDYELNSIVEQLALNTIYKHNDSMSKYVKETLARDDIWFRGNDTVSYSIYDKKGEWIYSSKLRNPRFHISEIKGFTETITYDKGKDKYELNYYELVNDNGLFYFRLKHKAIIKDGLLDEYIDLIHNEFTGKKTYEILGKMGITKLNEYEDFFIEELKSLFLSGIEEKQEKRYEEETYNKSWEDWKRNYENAYTNDALEKEIVDLFNNQFNESYFVNLLDNKKRKKMYKKMAMAFHPDKNDGDDTIMKKINNWKDANDGFKEKINIF